MLPFTPTNDLVLPLIAAGIGLILVAIVILIPATRYAFHLVYLHVNGMLDAWRLAGRPVDAVTRIVGEKYRNLDRKALFSIARLQRRWLARRAGLWDRYIHAQHSYVAAAQRLSALQEQALDQPALPEQFPWISPRLYIPIQSALGLGDAVLSFFAMQVYGISYVGILIVVSLIGATIAGMTHICGQALREHKSFDVALSSIVLALFILTVGALRFVYLAEPRMGSGSTLVDGAFSFGLPLALILAGIAVSKQHITLTQVADAQLKLHFADREYEAAYRRGKDEADALLSHMREIVQRTHRLCGAYSRGFDFHWLGAPIDNDRDAIEVPSADECWPSRRAELGELLGAIAGTEHAVLPHLPAANSGAVA